MVKQQPIAFISYVRFDDEHENGRITQLREHLSAEVRMQTGEELPIFQDRKDILWGQNWKERIEESLDEVNFLIPIITPSFFKSPACRGELERFLERERKLKRDDLILPIYYVNCPLLNDETKRLSDNLAQEIAKRQYADWRDLRFEPFTSPKVSKMLAQLAVQISNALERVETSQSAALSEPAPSITNRQIRTSPMVGITNMKVELLLSIPENRAVVRALSLRVLAEVATADEVTVSASFIEPLIDMADRGEVVSVEASDKPGGFGGNDLLAFVVVPVVAEVVVKLLIKGIGLATEEARKKLKYNKEAKAILKITIGDVEAIVTRTRSKRGRDKINALTQSVNAALLAYVES
jgi:hypothetical protein